MSSAKSPKKALRKSERRAESRASESEGSEVAVSQQQISSSSTVTTVTKTSVLTATPMVGAAGPSTSTPPAGASSSARGGSRRRSKSPLAISREQEKDELAHLNSQLACYIEFVRSQEQSAATVRKQYETLNESVSHEITQSTGLYEKEIDSLRRQLDKLAKEKTELVVSLDKANADRARLEKALAQAEKTIKELQRRLEELADVDADNRGIRSENDRLRAQLAALDKELQTVSKETATLRKQVSAGDRAQQDSKRLQAELQEAQGQLRATRDQLETEVKLKTDLENRMQTLIEDSQFKDSLLKEERSRFHERSVVIEEVSRVREAEFESQLCEELRRAREDYDQAIAEFKLDLESTFKTKLEDLRKASDRYSQDAKSSRDELLLLRKQFNDSSLELEKARKEAELLRANNSRLEESLRQEREAFEQQIQFLKEEERRNRDKLAEQLEEYNNLLTSKLTLDQEILAYRKLLEEEQRRTKYSPHKHTEYSSPFQRGVKRRLEDESSFAELHSAYNVKEQHCGCVRVSAIDHEGGQFIRLANDGDKDQAVGNWALRCSCDGVECTFKFNAKAVVKAGAECTVWSSDSGKQNSPPSDYLSKNKSFGSSAKNIKAVLVDTEEKEMASREMIFDQQKLMRRKRTKDDTCCVM